MIAGQPVKKSRHARPRSELQRKIGQANSYARGSTVIQEMLIVKILLWDRRTTKVYAHEHLSTTNLPCV